MIMSTCRIFQIDEAFISAMVKRYQRNPSVELSESEREQTDSLLECAAVDFELLRVVCCCVADSFDGKEPLRFPNKWTSKLTEAIAPQCSRLPIRNRLPEERLLDALENGIRVLSDEEAIDLMVNPVAMCDLFETIDEVLPDAWLGVMQEVGTVKMHMGDRIDKLSHSPRNQDPSLIELNRTLAPSSLSNNSLLTTWAIAGVTLACAASIVGLIVNLSLLRGQTELAQQLAQRDLSIEPAKQPKSFMQNSSIKADWVTAWKFYDPSDLPKSVSDMKLTDEAIGAYIANLETRSFDARQILACIKSLIDAKKQVLEGVKAKRFPFDEVEELQKKGLSDHEILAYFSLQ